MGLKKKNRRKVNREEGELFWGWVRSEGGGGGDMEELGCTWAWYAVLPLLLPAPGLSLSPEVSTGC